MGGLTLSDFHFLPADGVKRGTSMFRDKETVLVDNPPHPPVFPLGVGNIGKQTKISY